MGAATQYYVDPAIAADSGSGTIGDPYGDLQFALNSVTRNATNGDQFNIKQGTDEILSATLSRTSYGTPTSTAPLILRGYNTALNDGGVGGINLNGGNYEVISSAIYIHFIDLHIHNNITQRFITAPGANFIANCEFNNGAAGVGLTNSGVYNCNFHDISGGGVIMSTSSVCVGNYFKNGAKSFSLAIEIQVVGSVVTRNILSLSGASNGIRSDNNFNSIHGNSILSSSGTGKGLQVNGNFVDRIFNNLIEGFSNGGIGFDLSQIITIDASMWGNAAFNNTTNYSNPDFNVYGIDNEVLGSTLFEKSGADTFANRKSYFAPVDLGNIRTGGMHGQHKGAIAPAGSSGLILIRQSNSLLTR
jgi:hypothetical protein